MFIGGSMIRQVRITIFIYITLILMYIGVTGLILLNDEHDLTSIILVTMILFILAGCVYKAVFENRKNT